MIAKNIGRKVYGYEEGQVWLLGGDMPRLLTRAQLLALPVDGPVWDWLRAQGMRRPHASGPRGDDARRTTVQVLLRLQPAARGELVALAARWGVSVNEAVTRMVREAR